MRGRKRRLQRDVEKACGAGVFAGRLRRLADCLDRGRPFRIQIAGRRLVIPTRAICSVEHEREGSAEEVEFQMKWTAD